MSISEGISMTKKVLLLVPWALFCVCILTHAMQKDFTPYLAFNNKQLIPIAYDGSLDIKNTITMVDQAVSSGGTLHVHPGNRCAISFTNNGNPIKIEVPLSEKQIDYLLTKYSSTKDHEENVFYSIEKQLIHMKTIHDYRPKPVVLPYKTSPEKSLSCTPTQKQILSITASSFIILAILSYLLHD